MKRGISDQRLLCYLEREVTASEATTIEAALEDPACRRRLDALRRLLDDLAAPVAAEEDAVDVAATVRARIEAGDVGRDRSGRGRRKGGWAAALVTVALAGGAALALGLRGAPTRTRASGKAAPAAHGGRGAPARIARTDRTPRDEFVAKSSGVVPSADRWVAIDAYRVPPRPGAAPERLGRRIGDRDGLLFAYSNAARPPFRYLMIFAVDARGRVYWYYPAYERADENPASVPIETTEVRRRELPDLVHQGYAPGRLVIYGLFTRTPLRVHAVERKIAALVRARRWNAARPPRLPFPRAGQERLSVEVTR